MLYEVITPIAGAELEPAFAVLRIERQGLFEQAFRFGQAPLAAQDRRLEHQRFDLLGLGGKQPLELGARVVEAALGELRADALQRDARRRDGLRALLRGPAEDLAQQGAQHRVPAASVTPPRSARASYNFV